MKPLSEDEKSKEQNILNAKESGFDISSILKDKAQTSFNGNHSDDSNHTDNSNDFSQESLIGTKNNVSAMLFFI